MPLLVTPGLAPPPPPPRAIDLKRPTVTWTAADGSVTYLTANGIILMEGSRGLDMPPYELYVDESPGIDGGFYRGARGQVREMFLPICIYGDNREQFLQRKRLFLRRLNPKHGPATLTWQEPNGSRRHIQCYYTGGMEGDYERTAGGSREWQKMGLELKALSPYWQGDVVRHEWLGDDDITFFPLVHDSNNFIDLLSANVLGDVKVNNVGDTAAYPRWRIQGPATGILLENTTQDKHISLGNLTITGSEERVIDCRPGEMTIVDEEGENCWPELTADSALWHLDPGVNDLSLQMAGSTNVTKVTLRYQLQYEGV